MIIKSNSFSQIVLTSAKENFVGPQLRLCDSAWHFAELSHSKDKIHFRLDEFSKAISVSSQIEILQVTLGASAKGNVLKQKILQVSQILRYT